MSNLQIWALVIDEPDEQNTCLFWRKKDAIEQLECTIGEMCEEKVAEKALAKMPDVDSVIRYLNKACDDIEWGLEEVPIEGEVDGAILKKIQKLCKGPRDVEDDDEDDNDEDEDETNNRKYRSVRKAGVISLSGVCLPPIKMV